MFDRLYPSTVAAQCVSQSLRINGPQQAASGYFYYGPAWSQNFFKGDFLERAADRIGALPVGRGNERAGTWAALTPARRGRSGIDNIFVRMRADGTPTRVSVVEAKFESSRLGNTRLGKQMSRNWVSPKLKDAADLYRGAANSLARGEPSSNLLRLRVGGRLTVPLSGKRSAVLDLRTNRIFSQGGGVVTRSEMITQSRRISAHLIAAADGRVPYTPQIYRLQARDGQWQLAVEVLEAAHGKVLRRRIFGEGTPTWQRLRPILRRTLTDMLREMGCPDELAGGMADKVLHDPYSLSMLQKIPRVSWSLGLREGLLKAGLPAAVLSMLIDLTLTAIHGRSIKFARTLKTGALAGAGGIVGYYVASQIQARVLASPAARAIAAVLPLADAGGSVAGGLGGAIGGTVASVAIAMLGYLMGLYDKRDAKWIAASGVASSMAAVLFSGGTMGLVMAFGTAGTGAAISGLSGIAATNAALALLGGGTLAAGGGGVAAGVTVLSGGAAAVAIAIGLGVMGFSRHLAAKDAQRLLEQRMLSVERWLGSFEHAAAIS